VNSGAPALGAVFPHQQIGSDPDGLRAYVRGLEELGLAQLVAYDHVLGAGLDGRPDWRGPYSEHDVFHELFTLFAFFAALTERLAYATCVLVLPQRQAPLVAKQAAELQILSGGRFRLGVGTGWNEVEYEGMGVPFARRGARIEEQIALIRALWSNGTIDFDGSFHRVDDAGINPLPDPPPEIWLGGGATQRALDRIARLADGWMMPGLPLDDARARLAELRRLTAEHGRDPSAMGLEVRLYLSRIPRERWRETAEAWSELGTTHLNLVTEGLGLTTVDEQLETLSDALAEIAS
jgi:probable F420-dependent oxidoreductase